MGLPVWIPDALRSEQRAVDETFWRCVEAQHVVSTCQLVDTLDEQHPLEDILEEATPPVLPACESLRYLCMVPFRHGLHPNGSRFRRPGPTPGVCYVSEVPATAIIETAFHLLLLHADSPGTPFPSRPSELSAFDVSVKTANAIDLMAKPFSAVSDIWMHPVDYEPCQQFEEARAPRASSSSAMPLSVIRTTVQMRPFSPVMPLQYRGQPKTRLGISGSTRQAYMPSASFRA